MSSRVALYGEEFDALIRDHGITCNYYPAIVCDCITKDSQQPIFTCPKCGGSGYRYLPHKQIKVLVTSFSSKSEQAIMSLRESGTAYATPPPSIIMGFHDRLVFPEFKCKYSERMWVDVNGTVTNKSFRNIKDVISVIHGDYELEAGIDYEITEDGYGLEFTKPISQLLPIDWSLVDDNQVPISVLYYTTPSYLVEDLLHELRSHYNIRYVANETFEELPKQYRLKREDFVYDIKAKSWEDDSAEEPAPIGNGLFD